VGYGSVLTAATLTGVASTMHQLSQLFQAPKLFLQHTRFSNKTPHLQLFSQPVKFAFFFAMPVSVCTLGKMNKQGLVVSL